MTYYKKICSLFLAEVIFVGILFSTSVTAAPLFSANKMVLIDGKPRFLLGLCELPADEQRFQQAVQAGFNIFRSSDNKADLDRIHQAHAHAWICLGRTLDLSQDIDNHRARLLEVVNKFKNHPALLVWEGPDEALWNSWYLNDINFSNKELPRIRELAAQHKDLQDLARRIELLKARALWSKLDAARDEFWKKAGQPIPLPHLRFAQIPEQARKVGQGITDGIEAVRKADPDNIISLNHAPRNSIASLRFYNRAVDMAGCDIYPVPPNLLIGHSDFPNVWLSCVGEYTDRMRQAAPGKACAMVLQGFGWRDLHPLPADNQHHPDQGRRPTFEESRFMAYDAILHGANAIIYWGTHFAKDKVSPTTSNQNLEKSNPQPEYTLDTQLWRDLLRLARELSALEDALVAPTCQPAPQCTLEEVSGSVDDKGLTWMLKKVDKDYLLIIANETRSGLAFTIGSLPQDLDSKMLYRLSNPETVTVKNGRFRDGIRSFNVHVYATSRRFASK